MKKRVSSNGGSQGAPKEKKHCQATSRMCNNTSSNGKSQVAPKKKSTVYVRRMVEEVFPVEVDLNAPVKTLKEEIQKKKRIGTENQQVDFDGVFLQDDQPLSAYGIKGSSRLRVMDITGSGRITVSVKTPTETFPISLSPQSRLLNLHQKIFDLRDVDVNQQKIMFYGTLQTNPCRKLDSFGPNPTVELHLPRVTTVTVLTASNGSSFHISVNDFETVHSVKMTIFRLLHIIPSAQWISMNDVQVKDAILMREYKLTEESILMLYENTDAGIAIEVTVKLPSEIEIKVWTGHLKSVYSLMKQIEEIGLIPITAQYLYLNERLLVEWKSLGECRVINGSKINLRLTGTKIGISVLFMTGNSCSLFVDFKDSVSSVKDKLVEKTGFSADAQYLIYDGRELNDEHTLVSQNVQPGSTLHLLTSLRAVKKTSL